MIRALIAAALLATPAAAQAPPMTQAQAPMTQVVTYAHVLEICRVGVFEDRPKALAMLNALPAEMQPFARLMCASYEAGANALLAKLQDQKAARYI